MRTRTPGPDTAFGHLPTAIPRSPGSDTTAAMTHRARTWVVVLLVVAVTVLLAVDLVLLASAVLGLAGPG